MGTGLFPRAVKLTTHLHLAPMLRIRGSLPQLPNTSSWCGSEFFAGATASIRALGTTRPHIQWTLGVKLPEREADNSSPFSTEVKNVWSYTSTPPYVFMAWCLIKRSDNFAFSCAISCHSFAVPRMKYALEQPVFMYAIRVSSGFVRKVG